MNTRRSKTVVWPMTRPKSRYAWLAGLGLAMAAAGSAHADSATSETVPAGSVTVDDSGALTVRVREADCRRLVSHVPDAGVAYEPGVDVRGESVAPADLHGGHDLNLPSRIAIPIEVELYRRVDPAPEAESGTTDPDPDPDGLGAGVRGRTRLDPALDGDARIGTVEIDLETGDARFEGRPLTSAAQRRLDRRCQEILRGE